MRLCVSPVVLTPVILITTVNPHILYLVTFRIAGYLTSLGCRVYRMVKDYATHNNTAHIKRLLKVLGQDFTLSQNPNSRKGGLIGLAATAIALGKVSTSITYTQVVSNTSLISVTLSHMSLLLMSSQCLN